MILYNVSTHELLHCWRMCNAIYKHTGEKENQEDQETGLLVKKATIDHPEGSHRSGLTICS